MNIDSYEDGVPSWVDISVPDIAASAEFYAGLFGWDCPEGPAEFGGYRVCSLNGRSVAGIGPQFNPNVPVAWCTYVNVTSADETSEKVAAAGGQVMAPAMDVGEMGRMAIYIDTTGAVFGAWQPGLHTGAQIINEPGALCWNELVTTDVDAAKAFYPAVFGWGVSDQGVADDAGSPYTEWKVADRSIGGMMPKPENLPPEVPSYWGTYFAVADCDAAAAKVTELGGAVLMPPMDIEPGRFAVVADPFGGMFMVMTMKPELQS